MKARRTLAAIVAVTAATAGTLGTAGSGTAALAAPAPEAAAHATVATAADQASTGAPGGHTYSLTLITGDVARLTVLPDGRQTATLVRGEGGVDGNGAGGGYHLSERDGDVQLVPDEALPYVASGQLDARLFNLSDLVAQGYDDRSGGSIPVLLTAPPGARTAKTLPRTPAATSRTMALPSAHTLAVTPRRGAVRDFWRSIDDDRPGDGVTRLAGGIGKVWLDARLHATLDQSVPQIGAPSAWQAGFTGKGVKVAVLDSGYDAGHPDLAGRVSTARSFVPDSDGVSDHFGHGTHVASTVAGSGAASGGSRKGVAPESDLVIGKVLDDTGGGQESWAIAGMQWAVDQGARVVNMSFGGFPSDGSDPVSAAVDELSASSDALFVVAAGNAGPQAGTVTAPGAASAALTVGAVDKQDQLASFSSRGPRLGDGAVKPEVTAPGVAIAAARAAGTDLGFDLSEYYTSMDGTSMATPHVAGAAALLAQQHPDWSGSQLKNALASTARPTDGVSVAAQGAGRIDVARAVTEPLEVSAASVSFGALPWTGDPRPALTREVTYRNPTRKSVRLTLDLSVPSLGAGERPAAALTLDKRVVAIGPGRTATVTLRLDPDHTEPGSYAGVLLARGETTTLRTPVGFTVGAPTHDVTVSVTDRDGGTNFGIGSDVEMWNLDTGELTLQAIGAEGSTTLRVPTGRYSLMVFANLPYPGGWQTRAVAMLGDPEVSITGPRSFHFDARDADPVSLTTPRAADPGNFGIAWHRSAGDRSEVSGKGLSGDVTKEVYVQPMPRVSTGTFEFLHRWDLAQPQLTARVTGPGGFHLPTPRPAELAPTFVGEDRVRVVDGGSGTPAEVAKVATRGSVVLVQHLEGQVSEQARAAAAAGARVLFVYNDTTAGPLNESAEGATIPVYQLERVEGLRLRALLAKAAQPRTVLPGTRGPLKPGETSEPVRIDLAGVSGSGYRYDVIFRETKLDRPIRHDLKHVPLATIRTDYHQQAVTAFGHREDSNAFLPGIAVGFGLVRSVTTPLRRTDYVSADPDTQWVTSTDAGPFGLGGHELSVARSFRPGQRVDRVWWPAIVAPAVPDITGGEVEGLPVARFEDAIRIVVPQFVSGDGQIYGYADKNDTTRLVLRRNGTEVGRADWSAGQFVVPPSAADYELELDVRRAADTWTRTSTASHTVWTFRSGHVSGREVLPLPQVGYRLDTDLRNQVSANRPASLVLSPGYQPGGRGPGGFRVSAAISYDDGAHWRSLRTRNGHGDTVVATVPPAPKGAGDPSVRVTVTDRAHNKLTQTIEKAWHTGGTAR
ncbi:S8 family peptidase [Actinopolymorpha pittospori]